MRAETPVACALAVAAGLAAGACSLFGGGPAFDAAFARDELGCDYRPAVEQSRRLRASRPDSTPLFEPAVGWNACAVLSHNGPPDRMDREERPGGPVLLWRYDEAPGRGLVALERAGCRPACGPNVGPWTVSVVRW